jgi:predicted nuclease of predicted toxin-antitoxin system
LTRVLLDQGLPRSTAKLLSAAGWDAAHVADIGLSRAEDSRILERARQEARTCVTLDADFHALLATSEAKSPSVVRIRREGLNGKAISDLLLKIWPRIGRGGCRRSGQGPGIASLITHHRRDAALLRGLEQIFLQSGLTNNTKFNQPRPPDGSRNPRHGDAA